MLNQWWWHKEQLQATEVWPRLITEPGVEIPVEVVEEAKRLLNEFDVVALAAKIVEDETNLSKYPGYVWGNQNTTDICKAYWIGMPAALEFVNAQNTGISVDEYFLRHFDVIVKHNGHKNISAD